MQEGSRLPRSLSGIQTSRPRPVPSPDARTGAGAGANRRSGRARPGLRAALEPRTPRHAHATVLGAHLDLDVAAPPPDRDVIATVAALAEVRGRLPLALA